jgi:hypothetical protein
MVTSTRSRSGGENTGRVVEHETSPNRRHTTVTHKVTSSAYLNDPIVVAGLSVAKVHASCHHTLRDKLGVVNQLLDGFIAFG